MKANELMIGDWVNVTAAENIVRPDILSILPKKGKVVGIDGDCIYVDFVEEPFMFGDIEPIPLTPEILEKNGFSQDPLNGHIFIFDKKPGEVIYYEYGPKYGLTIDNQLATIQDLKIKYVHDLQHALRLCGIEKEIEL